MATLLPMSPECVTYYTVRSEDLRANTWYLLWSAHQAGYNGDTQLRVEEAWDDTNQHIPLSTRLPGYGVSSSAAADVRDRYKDAVRKAIMDAGSAMSGDDCNGSPRKT
jgi:hypothetical protein